MRIRSTTCLQLDVGRQHTLSEQWNRQDIDIDKILPTRTDLLNILMDLR